MGSGDEQSVASAASTAGAPSVGRPVGLLEKLVAAVRPEFRVDVLVIDPTDPVYGGPPCLVGECPRAARWHGLCEGHGQRWNRHGRPDLGQFTASTSAAMRADVPLQPCSVPGCRNGRNSTGLCVGHLRAWHRAGSPPVGAWSAAVPPVPNTPPHGPCRVHSCTLWATAKTPLCTAHAAQWRIRGRPDVDDFAAAYDDKPLPAERIDLLLLEPDLRLEMQYVLQRRRDEQQVRIQPALVQHVFHVLVRSGLHSLLEWPDDLWRERIHADRGARAARPFLTYARRQLEHLCYGSGWDIEYPRDTWRLRNLAITGQPANLRFDRIPQPWLKDLTKRWIRWRLASGLSANHASRGVTALTQFAQFLAQPSLGVQRLDQVDRSVLEGYLAELRTQSGAAGDNHRRMVGLLGAFFHDIRRHRWDPSLPTDAVFFTEDMPRKHQRLPRALAEHVMVQVEHPDSLARWDNPAYRLITLILIRCGLRITDTVRLARDCIVHDSHGAPYLRYVNHKMKREALVPIDEELEREIVAQQQRPRSRWTDGDGAK
jgi:site-specific recombinase XerD